MKRKPNLQKNSWLDSFFKWKWETIALALGLIALTLGYWGFREQLENQTLQLGPGEAFYRAILLFSTNSGAQSEPTNWPLEIGRWFAILATLIMAIRGFFHLIIQSKIKYSRLKNHIIIFGYTEIGSHILNEFEKLGNPIVVIDSDISVKEKLNLSNKLFFVAQTEEIEKSLKQCQLENARYLFAVTNEDELNLQIANSVFNFSKMIKNCNKRLKCFIHIENLDILRICRNNLLFNKNFKALSLNLFNVFEISSRIAFKRFSPDKKFTLNRQQPYHIMIIGFGSIGRSLLLQTLRNGHFADGRKIRVSIIDEKAMRQKKKLFALYPGIEDLAELNFYEFDIETLSKEFILEEIEHSINLDTVFICLDNPQKDIETAFRMQKSLPENEITIIPMLKTNNSATGNLFSSNRMKLKQATFEKPRIIIFNMIIEGCGIENIVREKLDKFAQAINAAYCNKNPDSEPWHKLSEELKESNRLVADHFEIKMRALNQLRWSKGERKYLPGSNLSHEEIEMLAMMEHNRYFSERILAGWKKGKRDYSRKTNPTLDRWEKLDRKAKENNAIYLVETFNSLHNIQKLMIEEKNRGKASGTQSPKMVINRIKKTRPTREEYKKATILAMEISDEKIPDAIMEYLGKFDEVKYGKKHIRENLGGMIALQITSKNEPDFYIISKLHFIQNYFKYPLDLQNSTAHKLFVKLPKKIQALVQQNEQNFFLLKKNLPVRLIEMSSIGYPIEKEVTIESAFGKQTKPAGKEAYLAWSKSDKAYYMINSDESGFPANYTLE